MTEETLPAPQPSPEIPDTLPQARRRGRGHPVTKSLPRNEAGQKTFDSSQATLTEMVESAAQVEAKRRRATTVDSPDYDAAFSLIAGPPRTHKVISIVGDVAGAIGSGLIGYSVNIYTSGSKDWLPGHVAFLAGATLTLVAIVLKYVAPRG